MGTVTINIENEVENDFRRYVYKNYGKSKGVLGKAVTNAIKTWLNKEKQERLKEEALTLMKKGFNMGGMKVKTREELYER